MCCVKKYTQKRELAIVVGRGPQEQRPGNKASRHKNEHHGRASAPQDPDDSDKVL